MDESHRTSKIRKKVGSDENSTAADANAETEADADNRTQKMRIWIKETTFTFASKTAIPGN